MGSLEGARPMSKAKVVLTARVNDGTGKFPFINAGIRRNAIKFPLEHAGQILRTEF
jgi:hypothetical protein